MDGWMRDALGIMTCVCVIHMHVEEFSVYRHFFCIIYIHEKACSK